MAPVDLAVPRWCVIIALIIVALSFLMLGVTPFPLYVIKED
jgi:uncharacterized protein YoxC